LNLKQIYQLGLKHIKSKSDVLILMKKIFGSDRLYISMYGEKEENQKKINLFLENIETLKKGYPIQYLVENVEFLDLSLKVGPGVFIPRPETEILAKSIVDYLGENFSGNIIDLCSGSGCIPVYLKSKIHNSNVWAIEKSEEAFKYLKENCKNYDINLILGDIFDQKFEDESFDVIVSNPPYIKSNDVKFLDKNIQFEPLCALDGGLDGLDFYRKIVKNWVSKLKAGGILAFELGIFQYNEVSNIMAKNNFKNIEIIKDFSNIERIIIGTKN